MTTISYRAYGGDADLAHVMALVQSELSEPYVVYTFRYFLHQWCVRRARVTPSCSPTHSPRPHLAFLVCCFYL